MPNSIQIIINVVKLGYEPNDTWNCTTHLFRNSFNLGLRTMVQNGALQYLPLLKHVAMRTLDLNIKKNLIEANEALGS
jgi:hypothetical protein